VIYPIGDTVQCKVSFGVDRVPSGSAVYQIEIIVQLGDHMVPVVGQRRKWY